VTLITPASREPLAQQRKHLLIQEDTLLVHLHGSAANETPLLYSHNQEFRSQFQRTFKELTFMACSSLLPVPQLFLRDSHRLL
jgi:hypothetical protein